MAVNVLSDRNRKRFEMLQFLKSVTIPVARALKHSWRCIVVRFLLSNYPKESVQHTEQGESLKSRIPGVINLPAVCTCFMTFR